ncbi:Endonuclease/exonuclease/phosphatase [Chlamydoabsidia padenii]|nr:Endonuclease/exonuclease/phosphatase [Chlamydoabsidia padenii]
MGLIPGYDGYFSYSKTKPGYSGVAVYVKQPLQPLTVDERITNDLTRHFLDTLKTSEPDLLDMEGRSLIMDFGLFVLFNIYFPNDAGDVRMDFKMDYHQCVRQRINQLLADGRQVILAGDINAVHEEIDHCDPKQSIKEHGLTHFKDMPHRLWIDQLIAPKGPLLDTCRHSHPDRKGMFTCWNTKINARPANFGTRIDYILISQGLIPWFNKADIRPDILGSDHCPVYTDFWDTLPGDKDTNIMDLFTTSDIILPSSYLAANYPEFKQKKLSTYFNNNSNKIDYTSPTSISITPSPLTSSTSTLKRKDTTKLKDNNKRQQQNTIKSFFSTTPKSTRPKTDEIDEGDMESIMTQIEEREETNQVWTNLFQPPTIPTCQVHQIKCTEHTVNKKGPNQGRRFFLCSKPVGPQDANKLDYRCNFFQWKHDKKN